MQYAVCESATGKIVAVFNVPVTAEIPEDHEVVEIEELGASATHLAVAAMSAGMVLNGKTQNVVVPVNTLTIDAPETINCGEELDLTIQAIDDDGNPTTLEMDYHLKMTWGLDILIDEDRSLVEGTDAMAFTMPDARPLVNGEEQPYSIVVVATVPSGAHRGCSVRVEVPEPGAGSPGVIGGGGKLGGGLP